jgi:hypothetical protein
MFHDASAYVSITYAEFKYIYGPIYVGSCFDIWFSFLKHEQEYDN